MDAKGKDAEVAALADAWIAYEPTNVHTRNRRRKSGQGARSQHNESVGSTVQDVDDSNATSEGSDWGRGQEIRRQQIERKQQKKTNIMKARTDDTKSTPRVVPKTSMPQPKESPPPAEAARELASPSAEELVAAPENSQCSVSGQHSPQSQEEKRKYDKVIFLDVDGVLHSVTARSELHYFDEACMRRLADIVQSTSAELVISSTWRKEDAKLRKLNTMLGRYGMPPACSTTRMSSDHERHEDIKHWLRTHQVATWLAIDDLPMGAHLDHFVQTDSMFGLSDRNIIEAIFILGRTTPLRPEHKPALRAFLSSPHSTSTQPTHSSTTPSPTPSPFRAANKFASSSPHIPSFSSPSTSSSHLPSTSSPHLPSTSAPQILPGTSSSPKVPSTAVPSKPAVPVAVVPARQRYVAASTEEEL